MPHLSIEYSANLEQDIDISRFCDRLRSVATTIDAFPAAGVRVRAYAAQHYSIADGNPKHGFIDISVRLREGRDVETRKAAVQTIFEAAKKFLEPVFASRSLTLSIELRNIDAELSPKFGNIRDHLNGN